jgi:hypothetical protein
MLWWLSSIRIPKSNGSQAIKRWLRSVRIFKMAMVLFLSVGFVFFFIILDSFHSVSIIYASGIEMSTAFPSVFRIMGTGQRNMLRDGWEQFPEHMYPEGSITGHHIFDLVGILVEPQADVLHRVIFVG